MKALSGFRLIYGLLGLITFIVVYFVQFDSNPDPAQKESVDSPEIPARSVDDQKETATDLSSPTNVVWSALPPADNQNEARAEPGVRIRMNELSLIEGEEISIPVPQEDRQYTGIIDRVTVSKSGNRTASGTIDGSTIHKFTITVGRTSSFATFNTVDGSYQLTAVDGVGTIVSTASIRARVDFSKPDYRIPQNQARPAGQDGSENEN